MAVHCLLCNDMDQLGRNCDEERETTTKRNDDGGGGVRSKERDQTTVVQKRPRRRKAPISVQHRWAAPETTSRRRRPPRRASSREEAQLVESTAATAAAAGGGILLLPFSPLLPWPGDRSWSTAIFLPDDDSLAPAHAVHPDNQSRGKREREREMAKRRALAVDRWSGFKARRAHSNTHTHTAPITERESLSSCGSREQSRTVLTAGKAADVCCPPFSPRHNVPLPPCPPTFRPPYTSSRPYIHP